MMRTFCFVCISFFLHFISCGQDTVKCDQKHFEDGLLNKLAGHWNLSGSIGGQKVENSFSAQWILNHQFIELNFVDIASPPTYMAKVLIGYDCMSERYVMHWLDNSGGRSSETLGYGLKKEKTITFRFESPYPLFINEFSYDNQNATWHLHMTIKNEKGEWIVFGDEYLKRKK